MKSILIIPHVCTVKLNNQLIKNLWKIQFLINEILFNLQIISYSNNSDNQGRDQEKIQNDFFHNLDLNLFFLQNWSQIILSF